MFSVKEDSLYIILPTLVFRYTPRNMMVANLLVLFLLLTSSNAFLRTVDSPMRAPHFMKNAHHYLNGHNSMKSLAFVPLFASSSRDKKERDKASVILTSSEDGEDIDGSIFENAETGQPPDWMVMKEVSCWTFFPRLVFT
jgi:hypothetical protein